MGRRPAVMKHHSSPPACPTAVALSCTPGGQGAAVGASVRAAVLMLVLLDVNIARVSSPSATCGSGSCTSAAPL
eukprot:364723-Chlamydomonas_euryale.AAC.3